MAQSKALRLSISSTQTRKDTYLPSHLCQPPSPKRRSLSHSMDRLWQDYQVETYTPTADPAKMLFNNVVSTPGATFFCLDLANFYLKTPFTHPSQYEYIWIPAWAIPDDILDEHNLRPLIKNGRILAEIRTGMYGLPQAGRMAYIKLIKHLAEDGYLPTGNTPGLFRHITRPTIFNLVVDDFGCMVIGDTRAEHLINTLKKKYDVTIDCEGKIFCGIHLKWNYEGKSTSHPRT